ncbi:hypothetical protein B0H16DRAFT_1719917 [Mycena metata]|uniref:Uncharacterized protein n=1 Tax=Mycena metata TaxID=1033252 RepID=A0AAD7J9Y2_9AGAR|nr:hypothetical protein B0H16DRAFT_1719917 [Mycena metata]
MDDISEDMYPLRQQYNSLLASPAMVTQRSPLIRPLAQKTPGVDEATVRKGMEAIRRKLIATINCPLAEVCDKFPPAPFLATKVAMLRWYIRKHGLDRKRGHSHRPFWEKVDAFYAGQVENLGDSFDSPGWKTFLDKIMDEDCAVAPTRKETPLFTSKPLMMNLSHILNEI